MARQLEEGFKAKYKYQTLLYFPFGAEPGSSFLLTSDPWSFLKAWIDKELNSRNFRGDNKARYIKARYFVEQAESFEIAGNKTNLPTKATLLYYSMLNLVKSFLSINGLDLEKKEESHGISLTEIDYELKISGRMQNCTNIFYEFCKLLGKPINGVHQIKLQKIVSDIPELHELCYSLDVISKRIFLPVEIQILTNKDHDKLFTEVSYKKENEARLSVDKFLKNERKKLF